MKKFFSQDTVWVGLVVGLGSLLLSGLIVTTVFMATGLSWEEHARWFGISYIPLLLILRTYAKRKEQLTVTRTLITVLFVTFLAFMVFLIKNHLLIAK